MEHLAPQRKGSHIEAIIIRAILQHLTFNNDAIHLAAILSKGPTVCITTNAFFPFDIYIYLSSYLGFGIQYIPLIFNTEDIICVCANWIWLDG